MALFTVEKLPNMPVVLFTAKPGYDIMHDLGESIMAAVEVIDSQSKPIYYIQDIRNLQPDLDGVVDAANRLSRGDSPLYHHPKILKVIGVTSDAAVRMAFKGMNSTVFGNTEVLAFDTVDEAIAYVLNQR
jgi:hypothetical protein